MTAPGPPPYRIMALLTEVDQAQAQLRSDQATLDAAVSAANAAIATLTQIATTAQNAVVTSQQDRAALHAQLNALATQVGTDETADAALTTRVTTLENTIAKQTDLTALTARVAALEAKKLYIATGALSKPLTLGVAGQVTTFAVPLSAAMPDAGYTVSISFDSNLLGTLTVQSANVVKTKTSVSVPLVNSALLSLATSITVFVTAASYQ